MTISKISLFDEIKKDQLIYIIHKLDDKDIEAVRVNGSTKYGIISLTVDQKFTNSIECSDKINNPQTKFTLDKNDIFYINHEDAVKRLKQLEEQNNKEERTYTTDDLKKAKEALDSIGKFASSLIETFGKTFENIGNNEDEFKDILKKYSNNDRIKEEDMVNILKDLINKEK